MYFWSCAMKSQPIAMLHHLGFASRLALLLLIHPVVKVRSLESFVVCEIIRVKIAGVLSQNNVKASLGGFVLRLIKMMTAQLPRIFTRPVKKVILRSSTKAFPHLLKKSCFCLVVKLFFCGRCCNSLAISVWKSDLRSYFQSLKGHKLKNGNFYNVGPCH